MGARVSVTTSSQASAAASRSSAGSSATRDPVAGGATSNGFSSQLNAAAAHPQTPDGGGEPRAASQPTGSGGNGSSGSANAANAGANTKGAAATTNAANSASTTSGEQVQNAAATAAEADLSSIIADLSTQGGKLPDKGSAKAPSDGTDSSATSAVPTSVVPTSVASKSVTPTSLAPTSLALLLAASGVQVNSNVDPATAEASGPPAGKSDKADDTGSTTNDQAAAALAGSIAAASLAASAFGALPTASPPTPTTGTAKVGDTANAVGSVSVAAKQVAQFSVDALKVGSTSADSSSSDSSLLQGRSSTPDSIQAPSGSATTPNGLPEIVRGLSASVSPAAGVERTISVPVSDRNWSGAVASQVQWLVSNNVQSATLQLSPDHLGPVEVRIDVQSSQVNVSFTASHPDTRSALEQSVPQLRAILANGGLTLGQTSVQQESRPGSHYSPGTSRSPVQTAQSVDSVSISSARGLGLIDEYA